MKTLHSINQPLESDVLDFSPGIEGKAYWLDERTIEFKPSQNLEPGKIYDATFELGRLVDVNEDLQQFKFSFQVVKPSFKIEEHGLRSINSSSLDLANYSVWFEPGGARKKSFRKGGFSWLWTPGEKFILSERVRWVQLVKSLWFDIFRLYYFK